MKVCKINMRDVKGKCMLLDCECSEEKCSKWKSLTNYDNIKAMNIDEMSDFLIHWFTDCMTGKAPMNVKQWLESEVAE